MRSIHPTPPSGDQNDAGSDRRKRSIDGISDLSRSRAHAPRTADLIYRELHDDIVAMRRKPNDRLSEKELIEHFGVSRTPLRAAISRLSDEGLVTVYPQAGTYVAAIPLRLLLQSIMIRKVLETLITEAATRAASAQDLEEIDANMAEMAAICLTEDFTTFNRIDSDFHRIIAGIAGLETVSATIEHVRAQIDRYRLMTLPQAGRMARVLEEHRAVRDALAAGDAQTAGSAMGNHIGQMLDEVEALDNLDHNYFYDDRDAGRQT